MLAWILFGKHSLSLVCYQVCARIDKIKSDYEFGTVFKELHINQ